MGKKSRKQNQELKLCSSLTDKMVIRHVENLFDATSKCSPGGAPVNPTPEIWEEYEAIMTLINAIEQRQGQSPVPLPPRKSAIPELVKWLKMNGGHFDKIEISEMPETGFGLRVLEAVKEEEMVIRVPNSLILSQSSAMSKELLGLVKSEPVLSAMPNLVLALILLNERYSPTSFWKPYINALPDVFDLPLYFSKEDMLELKGSPLLKECINQIRNIARLYAILHRQLRAYCNHSLHVCSVGFHFIDFKWAVSCVMSRQNKIPILHRQGVSVLALIPLWDMANHSSGKIMTDFDTGTQSCVCYSMTDLAPGEEFKIFYGPRGNSEFLLNQGFAIRDNSHDNIKMWIGVKNITDDALRKAIFDKLQIATFGQFVVSSNEGFPFSSELVTFVRLFTASEEELKLWQNETNDKVIEWISRKTWNKEDEWTLEFLEKRCQLLLLPYKTTIDVDVELLASNKLTSRTRSIVTLRLSEKLILFNASQFAAKVKETITKGEEIEWEVAPPITNETKEDIAPETNQSLEGQIDQTSNSNTSNDNTDNSQSLTQKTTD